MVINPDATVNRKLRRPPAPTAPPAPTSTPGAPGLPPDRLLLRAAQNNLEKARHVAAYTVGSLQLDEKALADLDVNGDGKVNVVDAMLFQRRGERQKNAAARGGAQLAQELQGLAAEAWWKGNGGKTALGQDLDGDGKIGNADAALALNAANEVMSRALGRNVARWLDRNATTAQILEVSRAIFEARKG